MLVLVLLSGCRADVAVGIDVKPDGSGKIQVEVTVDKDVTDQVDLSSALKVDDLRQAGWTVSGPQRRPGGMTAVTATMGFTDPAGAARAMDQISGPGGPFRSFRITHHSSFFTNRTSFRGTVDFTQGVQGFSDPALTDALGGTKALEQQLNGPINNVVHIQVSVRMPGSVTSNAPAGPGNGAVWKPQLGARADLAADARGLNVVAIAAVGGVAAVALVLVAFVVVRLVRRRHRPVHAA
jgi:hypothetical protein